MGAECPNGHGRQNIVENVFMPGSNKALATNVIAQRLACNCVVGGEEYRQFQEAVHKIEIEANLAAEHIRKAARDKKAAAYAGLLKAKAGE